VHWGNIGSFLAGLSTVAIAVAALIRSPAALRDWQARQRAQADAAREEAENIRLERRRGLNGWSDNIETYRVALVAEAPELEQAAHELARGGVSDYVVLRVAESDQPYGNVNRADSLRQLIGDQGLISRPPTAGEREALEKGLTDLGIMSAAAYRRERENRGRKGGSPASG
jgi:hypothetical protein